MTFTSVYTVVERVSKEGSENSTYDFRGEVRK